MWKYVEDIVKGALTSGVNIPTFWFLNGCLFALVTLCFAVALLSEQQGGNNKEDSEANSSGTDIDLRLHFSVMGLLAVLLGASLNYVILQAKVLKNEENDGKQESDPQAKKAD
jgi:hypothetical protein